MPTTARTRKTVTRSLSQAEVDELCQTAIRAWRQAPGSARRVYFVWQGKRYVARHTSFRLIIDTVQGEPVAYCYH